MVFCLGDRAFCRSSHDRFEPKGTFGFEWDIVCDEADTRNE